MKANETWEDRAIEFASRLPGDGIRFRIPEDLDHLIQDWGRMKREEDKCQPKPPPTLRD